MFDAVKNIAQHGGFFDFFEWQDFESAGDQGSWKLS